MLWPRRAKFIKKYTAAKGRLIEEDAGSANRTSGVGNGEAGVAGEARRPQATPIESLRTPSAAQFKAPTTSAI